MLTLIMYFLFRHVVKHGGRDFSGVFFIVAMICDVIIVHSLVSVARIIVQ